MFKLARLVFLILVNLIYILKVQVQNRLQIIKLNILMVSLLRLRYFVNLERSEIMSLNEKVSTIRQIVTLVCEILPQVVSLIKEVVLAIKELQTV